MPRSHTARRKTTCIGARHVLVGLAVGGAVAGLVDSGALLHHSDVDATTRNRLLAYAAWREHVALPWKAARDLRRIPLAYLELGERVTLLAFSDDYFLCRPVSGAKISFITHSNCETSHFDSTPLSGSAYTTRNEIVAFDDVQGVRYYDGNDLFDRGMEAVRGELTDLGDHPQMKVLQIHTNRNEQRVRRYRHLQDWLNERAPRLLVFDAHGLCDLVVSERLCREAGWTLRLSGLCTVVAFLIAALVPRETERRVLHVVASEASRCMHGATLLLFVASARAGRAARLAYGRIGQELAGTARLVRRRVGRWWSCHDRHARRSSPGGATHRSPRLGDDKLRRRVRVMRSRLSSQRSALDSTVARLCESSASLDEAHQRHTDQESILCATHACLAREVDAHRSTQTALTDTIAAYEAEVAVLRRALVDADAALRCALDGADATRTAERAALRDALATADDELARTARDRRTAEAETDRTAQRRIHAAAVVVRQLHYWFALPKPAVDEHLRGRVAASVEAGDDGWIPLADVLAFPSVVQAAACLTMDEVARLLGDSPTVHVSTRRGTVCVRPIRMRVWQKETSDQTA